MEDAGQQGAAPALEPESPATPATPAEATQEQRQLTVEELEQPTQPTQEQQSLQPQSQPLVRPQFSSRSVAPNEFQIFHGKTALGKRLTPSESAIVLAWAKSIYDSEV